MAVSANELMIGNLIDKDRNSHTPDGIKNGRPFYNEVTVTGSLLHAFEKHESLPRHYHYIPLTEEWLLKFGFEYYSTKGAVSFDDISPDDMTHWWEKDIKRSETNDRFVFNIVKWGDNGDFTFSHHLLRSRIKFVHQLQNLYCALTGTELTIKSETVNS